jgi:DNA repair protein RAD50
MIGKRDTYQGQIKEHQKELAKPMNRNIDEQYRQMLIQVKTTEMANGDLDKYHHALDKYDAISSWMLTNPETSGR